MAKHIKKKKIKFPKRQKRKNLVWIRDNFVCFYCGIEMKQLYEDWLAGRIKRKRALVTVDHVIPTSLGGTWDLDNLVTCCVDCNTKKGSKIYATEKSIPDRSQIAIPRLLELLALREEWSRKRRFGDSSHNGKSL